MSTAKLWANSNAVWTSKKPQEENSQKLPIWVRNGIIVALTAFSALAVRSCRSNAAKLEQVRQENRTLSADLNDSRKDAVDLTLKNQALRTYANEAHSFLNTMTIDVYPTDIDALSAVDPKEAQKAEEKAQREFKKEEAERDAALKTLGIGDEESKAVLMRLREGLQID